jgi:hypothetical protein
MAKIDSLSILLDPEGQDKLAELYGGVIANVQKRTLSSALKNKNLSGDPTSGTVEVKRYANAYSQEYGTARSNGSGNYVKAKPVTIAIDVDREIVEELEEKDAKLSGVDGLLRSRSANHVNSMVRELETAFFIVAAQEAEIKYTPSEDAISIAEQIEEMVLQLETVESEYVNGVDRSTMELILSPTVYSTMRNYLDTVAHNANVDTVAESFGTFHGVRVYNSIYMPKDVNAILMVNGSVAQPVTSDAYTAERIPLSNALALELFYNYGTKAVTPDLISVWHNE